MTTIAAVLLQILACLGFGAAVLRILGIAAELDTGEHWALAFATGLGVLGWLLFPMGVLGLLGPGPLSALLTVGAIAALLLRRPETVFSPPRLDAVGRGLLALLVVVLAFDLMEGIAPPADADSLAYHFENPKRFLEAGRIFFIPMPLNGAIPLLVHMTYLPALALGGDTALTLWTMASGWAAGAVLFALCRRYLSFNWSLAVMLLFFTTPAIIYGGGAGHVEARNTLFVMVAAWAVGRSLETGRLNYVLLAGLGSGFFAGGKYLGLLFAAACGLVTIFRSRWLVRGLVFSAAVLAAGFQCYAWNAWHTGDPVFPALFQWLGVEKAAFWSKSHDLFFKQQLFTTENPLPRSPLWFVFYPFSTTLGIGRTLDAGRVGFGPYGLLVLPFAATGVWRLRHRLRHSPLLPYAAITVLFYALWYLFGGSQRVRHLLPVLPLFLICVTVAAERFAKDTRFRRPLIGAVVATLVLQTGIHGLFALNYAKFIAGGFDREAFLLRNVNGYGAVPWINKNLPKTKRLLIQHRQLRFYLDMPSILTTYMQGEIELRPKATNTQKLHRQLREAGVTHMLLVREWKKEPAEYSPPLGSLARAGCLSLLKIFSLQRVQSRTLPGLISHPITLDLLALKPESCLE